MVPRQIAENEVPHVQFCFATKNHFQSRWVVLLTSLTCIFHQMRWDDFNNFDNHMFDACSNEPPAQVPMFLRFAKSARDAEGAQNMVQQVEQLLVKCQADAGNAFCFRRAPG